MRKRLTAMLILALTAGCILSALGWQNAAKTAQVWNAQATAAERQVKELEQALETSKSQVQALTLKNDPIAAFFSSLPYSGAAAGYLAFLETDAYRAELENAAELLRDGGGSVPIDAFLSFIDTQAQTEADAWSLSLKTQGAVTAGAWAHVNQCQIPIYRFGAYTLISAYQQTGEAYPFLFSLEDTRQTLLDAGFQEAELPPCGTDQQMKEGTAQCMN